MILNQLKKKIKILLLNKQERDRINALRKGMASCVSSSSGQLKESSSFWESFKKQLRDYCLNNDPRNFLSVHFIRSYFFVDAAGYIQKELESLMEDGDNWGKRYENAIIDDSNIPSSRSKYFENTNDNIIHHLYHISQYESFSGKHVDELDLIVEFGGGYGNMCRLIRRLGFKGVYIIFDGKELNLLQQFYLSYCNIKANVVDEVQSVPMEGEVYLVNNMDLLDQFRMKTDAGMLIGTWSLSEAPMEIRNKFMNSSLVSSLSEFLLAYQVAVFENDNEKYFNDLFSKKKNVRWGAREIPHIPNMPSKYIFGTKAY